ncbi:MAG: peptide deformylase [Pseudomonadota bacterium]
MAVLPLRLWPDPVLSVVCAPVGAADVRALASDMLDTMYHQYGRGLAAPQVGVVQTLFVMDAAWKSGDPAPMVCVDPVIVWACDTRAVGPEGCLSIPGVTAQVSRAVAVRLAWTDLDGTAWEAAFDGFAAVCIQHEMDHLRGVVTLDHLDAAARALAEVEYQG